MLPPSSQKVYDRELPVIMGYLNYWIGPEIDKKLTKVEVMDIMKEYFDCKNFLVREKKAFIKYVEEVLKDWN